MYIKCPKYANFKNYCLDLKVAKIPACLLRIFLSTVVLFVKFGTLYIILMKLIFTPMKQTSSRLQMVLLGLLIDGGQYGERPSQKLASRQPLSSLHLSPKRRLHSAVQHGPWKRKQTQLSKFDYVTLHRRI